MFSGGGGGGQRKGALGNKWIKKKFKGSNKYTIQKSVKGLIIWTNFCLLVQ